MSKSSRVQMNDRTYTALLTYVKIKTIVYSFLLSSLVLYHLQAMLYTC